MIYYTPGEQANDYVTDVVSKLTQAYRIVVHD